MTKKPEEKKPPPKKPKADQPKPSPPVKPKSVRVQVPMDDDLHKKATDFAKDKGVGLAALVRSVLRFYLRGWPDDPPELPPNLEDENRRPPRKKK